jgi:ceramide glucosyltransferase
VAIAPCVLRSVLGDVSPRDLWDREVRWSRCTRVSRPSGQLGYFVTFAAPLAAAFLVASGFGVAGWAALAASIALRWGVAAAIARETGDRASLAALPVLPLRDLMTVAVWGTALFGRRVTWRGEVFQVGRDGLLRPLSAPIDDATEELTLGDPREDPSRQRALRR